MIDDLNMENKELRCNFRALDCKVAVNFVTVVEKDITSALLEFEEIVQLRDWLNAWIRENGDAR